MTNKELKKLKKDELLELLFYMRKEIDNLRQENERLKLSLDNYQKVHFSQEDITNIMKAVEKIISSN
ncbi:MAG: hypothetical protein ACI4WH_04515 [Oscillospiraceae bacterium]